MLDRLLGIVNQITSFQAKGLILGQESLLFISKDIDSLEILLTHNSQ